MLSTSESQRRAYIVAVLLCSVFPASLAFWCVGFFVGMGIFLYVEHGELFQLQVVQFIALLASLLVVRRFWNITIEQKTPNLSTKNLQALLNRPRTVAGLRFLLVAGSLSALLGATSFVVGWIALDLFDPPPGIINRQD